MSSYGAQEIPEHVRRIIGADGEIEFTPPSFERWLGRLQMLRTLSAMGAFLCIWLVSYGFGQTWEASTIRGLVAAIVSFFFAWASGLLIFGEFYAAEVKQARIDLEKKERDRARRVEEYYRQRLQEQAAENDRIAAEAAAAAQAEAEAIPTPRYGTPLPSAGPAPVSHVPPTTPPFVMSDAATAQQQAA